MRDGFQHTVRGFPEELDGGGLFFEFEMFQADRIGAAAEQEDAAFFLPNIGAGADPSINDGLAPVVHGKAGAVLGADDEYVDAGFFRDDGAFPFDGKIVRREDFGLRAGFAEIEADLIVLPLKIFLIFVFATGVAGG